MSSLDSSILQDPHSLCSVLKLFFRELSEPLVPEDRYNEFIEAASKCPAHTNSFSSDSRDPRRAATKNKTASGGE
jgi:hypothetical protein